MADEEKKSSGKPIDDLRALLDQAQKRDEELIKVLEDVGNDFMKELHGEDTPAVWGKVEAHDHERQVTEHFLMRDNWMLGNLIVEVMPGRTYTIGLLARMGRHGEHEVTMEKNLSQVVSVDPKEDKTREENHKKLQERILGALDYQVRESVDLPEV